MASYTQHSFRATASRFENYTHSKSQQDIAIEKNIQYRQLVSRAVTQRLHSPSLDDVSTSSLQNTLEAWEMEERKKSRHKATMEARILGIAWEQFVEDVQRASQEVHVLTPTRYEAPPREFEKANHGASKTNKSLGYGQGGKESVVWEGRHGAIVDVLRMFGWARGVREGW
ncbi:hypothetical protein EJ02DRAFT_360312 [Clathrospora elynae]|uniref:Uncharacterized protein n=1 Tax=Clathrospora elynae TaxID=706981 RepID=A0A6A5SBX8_9PLEO|nr:hypothetical protein EJ02DRAFT_360312 [Clathrospora elynae]